MAAASSSSSSSTSCIIRAWRTAFLTLRDETLHLNESCKPIGELLNHLIFSHSNSLISASPNLPSHELASDLLFLLELAATSCRNGPDFILVFSRISHLMHDICKGQRVSLQLNSSSWILFLDSFAAMLQTFLNKPAVTSPNVDAVRPAMQCLESVRHLMSVQQKFLLADDVQLAKFLLQIIDCSHAQLFGSSYTSQRSSAAIGKGSANYCGFWEFQTLAFAMLSEAFTKFGSTFPADTWQCTIEVLRKVMDALTSKSLLSDDHIMSRFYASLLNCLHLVLMDPKGSLLDHVSAFVATLRMFFVYGLTSRPQFKGQVNGLKEKEPIAINNKLTSEEPKRINQAPYRPPHLRKRDSFNMNQTRDSSISSDNEYSAPDFASSDSDCSDSDGSLKDSNSTQNSRVRVAAIVCIQDLCQADPRSFTSQWTMLLPTNDVLQPRKFEATLMTCLLFDPCMKARIASASALAVMLDGPSSVFLQIAEYNESTKWGSFMALSSSLGCILMQLHTGVLYLIQREMHNRLLASLLKILVLLISSTPYARMPGELLPTVITSILSKIENRFIFRSDQSGQLASIISCLAAALSTSPPSPQVKIMLLEEISTGVVANERSGVLFTLFRYSEQLTSPATCYEALQALKAVAHNYPNITIACWEHISCIVSKIVALASPDIPMMMWKESMGDNNGFIGEKVIAGAVKVLDECLRATSGFKGTEDLSDDKLLETPFVSDCTRAKKVSSAPSFEPESAEETEGESYPCQSGFDCWSQTIEQFMPQLLRHTSAMVRAAAVTCFAGITSFVFFSLTEEKQEFTVSSLIDAAVHDDVPSVRSAACRAIGVISCFPKFFQSAEIFEKFIHAVEINSRDPLVSVRITSSWALANICESLRQCVDGFPLKESADSYVSTKFTLLLAECALRLTKDGDKIKSNAVRALGNLSRFVKYTSSSRMHDKLRDSLVLSIDVIKELPAASNMQPRHADTSNFYSPTLLADPCLLERIVQAFLSCVTTGNVKVQWNVCHALSNLFLNETLNLQDMDWAPSVFSILLLLLRDSSNFKIKIQAAAALAVPASVIDYGKSFSDVVQGLVHVLENLGSVQISAPSSFKYRAALEKQITSTMLHILALASSTDQESLKDFLVKKALFLEEWLKALCFSLEETSNVPEGANSTQNQKKWMISKAVRSLVQVYESRSHHTVAETLKKLDECIQWDYKGY